MKSDVTGKEYDLGSQQILDLATNALHRIEQEQMDTGKKDESKKEDMSSEERITNLESQIKVMEQDRKNKEEVNTIRTALITAGDKYDITKNNPKVAQKIAIITAAIHAQNKTLDVGQIYAEQVKEFTEMQEGMEKTSKGKINANAKVGAAVSGITRSEGGMPVIDTSKKWTGKDIKSGASKQALEDFLASMETE